MNTPLSPPCLPPHSHGAATGATSHTTPLFLAEPIARFVRTFSPARIASLALLLCGSIASAQSINRLVEEKLYRVARGYIGLRHEGGIATLTLYNDSLRGLSQSITQYQGLLPADLSAPEAGGRTQGRALMLASANGRARLFALSVDSIPTITPLWESDLPPMRRIVATGDFDRDGSTEAALVGDSAFCVVGVDGRPRFIQRGEFLDALLLPGDSTRFLTARHISGGRIAIALVDTRGTILAARDIAGTQLALMSLIATPRGALLGVATLGHRGEGYLFDPSAGLPPPDPFELKGAAPLAFLPYRSAGEVVPAVLLDTYPSPTLMPLQGDSATIRIDYPLHDGLRGATVTDRWVLLLACDSLAVYDHAMRFIGALPSICSPDASATPLDSGRLLVASTSGSRVVAVPHAPPGWIARNWLLLAIALMVAIIVVGLLVASRRYRFVRTIYDNLVTVPSSHGVIVISPSQKVRQVNQSARRMLEIGPYIPFGRHISEYLIADELKGVLASLRRLFNEGEEFETRVDVNIEGSQRALTFRGRPMLGRYGFTAGYLMLVEDVTQTLERERLVNWASVAHHIAHEMKTPLSTVTMTAELLHDRLNTRGGENEHARATGRIIKQAVRLREIVDDLLTIARTEALQKVPTDMAILFKSLIHDYGDTLQGSVRLHLEIAGSDFHCLLDVGQFIVAIRNLLDNAWQAIGSREGGEINVTLRESSNSIYLTIEDNGIGMSKSTLAKLFQPFYTERQGGSGIGTVIIKRVIEGHGGAINVESERGRGTKFLITLPKDNSKF
jgi:signal transduction histidine kinase